MWRQWVNAVLGLLIILFAYMGAGSAWLMLAGLIVLVLALWEVFGKKGGPAVKM